MLPLQGLSRVRTALVTAVMRLRLTRKLRKTCQVFRRGHAAFNWGSRLGECAIDGALGTGEFAMGRPPEAGGDPGTGARAGAIGQDGNALAFAGPDDPVGASRCQVEAPAGQGRRDPYHLADRVGHTNGSVR